MKRYLFLFSILALVILVVWAGDYFLGSLNPEAPQASPNDLSPGIDVLPPAGGPGSKVTSSAPTTQTSTPEVSLLLQPRNGFGIVVDRPIADFAVEASGSLIYVQTSGQVARLSGQGAEILSSVSIANLRHAVFSPDGKKVVVVFGSGETPQVSVFDVLKKSWEPLFIYPQSRPDWAPGDYRLAYIASTNGQSALEIIDLGKANAKPQTLTTLQAVGLNVVWKNSGQLIISEKGTAFAEQDALVYTVSNRTINPLFQARPGLSFRWYPLLDQGAVFVSGVSSNGGLLDLVDKSGISIRRFSFTALPDDKCMFAQLANLDVDPSKTTVPANELEATLICALPKDSSGYRSLVLPDEYWQGRTQVPEHIIRVSLYSGTYESMSAQIPGYFDATHLRLGQDTLYFINRFDQKIYGLHFPTH